MLSWARSLRCIPSNRKVCLSLGIFITVHSHLMFPVTFYCQKYTPLTILLAGINQSEASNSRRNFYACSSFSLHGWPNLTVTQRGLWTSHQEGQTKFSSLFLDITTPVRRLFKFYHPPQYTPPFDANWQRQIHFPPDASQSTLTIFKIQCKSCRGACSRPSSTILTVTHN